MASRQAGKSTVVACIAVAEVLFGPPGSLVLVVAPSLRQSAELMRKVWEFYRAVPGAPGPVSDTVLRLELPNGNRVVGLPGEESTIRGFSGVRLLLVDEAARVEDDLYRAIRPMLATSGGRLLALSTPWGKRGWFYEAWQSYEPWTRIKVPAQECPRIPAAFLEEEKRNLGDWWFRQEYLCEFADNETSVFRAEDIEAIWE